MSSSARTDKHFAAYSYSGIKSTRDKKEQIAGMCIHSDESQKIIVEIRHIKLHIPIISFIWI